MNIAGTGFGSLAFADNEDITSLDLYAPVSRNVSYKAGHTRSIAPISQSDPYIFNFPSIPGSYISFPSLRLFVEGKVVKSDGTEIGETGISVCDNLVSSLFQSCLVEIGGRKCVELSSENFNFKHYIESTLTFGQDAMRTHLQAGLKCPDQAGKYDDFAGTSVQRRARWIEKSRTFQGFTFLASDFMSCEKLLPSTHRLTVRLNRARDDFVLHTDSSVRDDLKIIISDIKLYVRYIDVRPSIVQSHIKQFEKDTQKYPIVRSELKAFSQPAGPTSINIHNCFEGPLPKSVLLLITETDRFTGVRTKNPYYFPNFSLNFASLMVNSERVPLDPYCPDFENNKYFREYISLFDSLGIQHENCGHQITPQLYKNGFAAISFSLSPDSCYHAHLHEGLTGNMGLELKFDNAPTSAFTVLLFATFDVLLTLDNKGETKAHYL